MPDLNKLILRLADHEVDMVIVGGYAAMAHGVTLLTQDIDICCSFHEDNLRRIGQALADLHPVHRMTPQRLPLEITSTFCSGLRNMYLDTDWGQLDCLSEVLGLGNFEQVRPQSIEIELEHRPCRLLSLPALILAKSAMGRDRDREAVTQLKAIQDKL